MRVKRLTLLVAMLLGMFSFHWREVNGQWSMVNGQCASAQINTDRVLLMGRNALYYEDYVLAIQRFNMGISESFGEILSRRLSRSRDGLQQRSRT